ncbi:MAG: serine/threonine protein kinase [bacterium]|nr:serine/threonine protein kinase [bacterium]
MGEVYKSKDLDLDVLVALKFLHSTLASEPSMVETLRNEVRIARQVLNPYICRVHDIGDADGRPFFSMEYVGGGSLLKFLSPFRQLPRKQALRIACELCAGLDVLHAATIMHRDLKPANILFDACGNTRITDFGLAGLRAEIASQKGLTGTPRYMSPEQLAQCEVLPQSDIFSLGAVLYEIFAGQPAFSGPGLLDFPRQHEQGPIAPRKLRQEIEPGVEAIILQCLELDPTSRPASARDVLVELAGILGDFAVLGTPMPTAGGGTSKRLLLQGVPLPTPFFFGPIAKGNAFLGRGHEMSTIFSRLHHGESSAIVGELRSGRSSLLYKLADTGTRKVYLGDLADKITVHRMDLSAITDEYTPGAFWKECLESLYDHPGDAKTVKFLEKAEGFGYERRHLQRLFDHLGATSRRLVLLLDDFEQLVERRNFRSDSQFFALLRTIVTTGNLTMIPASCLTVSELNKMFPPVSKNQSPYFNHVIDVHLRPFEDETIEELLGRAGEEFSAKDRAFIRQLAGRQPYLLQALGATLFEIRGEDRRVQAAQEFYRRVHEYFDELWMRLENRCKTVAIILGMAQWAGEVEGRNFEYSEIGSRDDVGSELKKLAILGLAEHSLVECTPGHSYCLLWRGERWEIAAHVFSWWLWELVASEDSLNGEAYDSLLTQKEWEVLQAHVRGLPYSRFPEADDMIKYFAGRYSW